MENTDETNCLGPLPVRKRLHHLPPVSVSQYAAEAEYFMTVCVDRAHYDILPADAGRRGPLADDTIAPAILESIEFRRENGEWYPRIALVMPDHVHFMVSFSADVLMDKVVGGWKRFLARQCGIVWQKGFFDHRLRDESERAEKWAYIESNPVAKGLCATAEDWPFRRMW